MTIHATQVGAPDPERRTSPILDDDEADGSDLALESAVCYFDGMGYPVGSYVQCGAELLRCAERGVWIRTGP